jgi:ferredoxin-NADP reductase
VEFRCYSLSLAPSRKQWRLTIRRQSPIDTAASFSAWVHREWRVGDRLRIRGPKGNFVLDRSDAEKPIVFFSAGVGITPILSMLQEELSFPRKRSKWVFHQLRSLANAPLLSELIAEVEHSEACRAVVAVSQLDTKPKCTSRNVCLDSGKLRLNEIVSSIGTNDFYAFMCGPSPWMKDVRAALVKNGVPDSQVFDESFGGEDPSSQPPAGDHSKAVATNIATFQISYEATGKQTRFDDNETNLLSHAKGQGVSLPSGCRSGHCGTCAVKLLRGNVCYSREPAAELAENEILTCICKPTSDIAIQA